MTQAATLPFGDFKVYLGDGASPEVFAQPCGFKQRALNLTASTSSAVVPDCDDDAAPAWEEHAVSSLTGTITGQGVLAKTAHATWRNFFLGATQKNIRVVFSDSLANDGGYYEGAAILTNLGYSAQLGSDADKVTLQVALQITGQLEWVASANA